MPETAAPIGIGNVVQHYVLGCETARIAQVMNVSEATVNTTVHHARKHLAAQLAMPFDESDRKD